MPLHWPTPTRSQRTRGSRLAPAWLPPAKRTRARRIRTCQLTWHVAAPGPCCASTSTTPMRSTTSAGTTMRHPRPSAASTLLVSLGLERSLGAMLAGNAAEPLLALGEWARASAMIERALELDPPAHHHAHLRLLQAWLYVWRGQLDEADAVLAEFRPMISRRAACAAIQQPGDPH